MGELIIADHALKHGLSPIEIEGAWKTTWSSNTEEHPTRGKS